jgi:ATP-dependent Clp protease ATP-binding subunit ClpA
MSMIIDIGNGRIGDGRIVTGRIVTGRAKRETASTRAKLDLETRLSSQVVGQKEAVAAIAPLVELWLADLAPVGRPAGVLLLLGPTGTGKTYCVEALAQLLHGNPKQVLRIDCGEYQMDHEVAKLIGAPPGYLGHKETQPLLSQAKLTSVTTPDCRLSLVLFDEIEKAAPSLKRLLLGVLDKATLRLGDNSQVDFSNTLIFATSNIGAAELNRAANPNLGFIPPTPSAVKGARMVKRAAEKFFSPEFLNRCDNIVTFEHLSREMASQILDQQLAALKAHLESRRVSIHLSISKTAKEFLLNEGFSLRYGARELRRIVQRKVLQPVAAGLIRGEWQSGAKIRVRQRGGDLRFEKAS